MDNKKQPIIFFHVGLGKTASTYLQYKVFPFFKNIRFIHRKPEYLNATKIIAKSKFENYLISREFDQQLEDEVKKFSKFYPDTTAIIVLRKHDSWIASQYRRFVKNGHAIEFTKFFDLKNNKGLFSIEDLEYYKKFEIIEKYFTKKPIVLFYDDLRRNPLQFFDYIAKQVGATYDKADINLDKKHSSYNENQLKAVFRVSKIIDIQKKDLKCKILHNFRKLFINSIRYSTLFIAKFLPNSFFSNKDLIDKSELQKVEEFYKKDWQACINYAQENNPK